MVPLTLRVLTGTANSTYTTSNQVGNYSRSEHVLRIEITQYDNPTEEKAGDEDAAASYFLYTLDVSESEYPILKRDQSLLVDFADFPDQFIGLVAQCRVSHSSTNASQRSSAASCDTIPAEVPPPYRARLTLAPSSALSTSPSSSAVFAIVEATPFKELSHLSLAFCPPTDHHLKAFLATRLQHLTFLHAAAVRTHHSVSHLLSEEQARNLSLTTALSSLRREKEEETGTLNRTHMEAMTTALAEHSREKDQLISRHESQMNALRKRCEETERRRMELAEARHANEAKLREVTRRVEQLTDRLAESDKNTRTLVEEKKGLEDTLRNAEKHWDEAKLREEGLLQKLKGQDDVLERTKALQLAAEGARRRMEEALELYKNNALALQEKLEVSVGEIQKGNMIIQKLQTETQTLRGKIKTKNEVLKKQEALLVEGRRGQDAGVHRLSVVVQENGRLTQELGALKTALEESRRENESNQQIITWLNKEINDLQLGRGSHGLMHATVGGVEGPKYGRAKQHNSSTAASVATFIPSYNTPAKYRGDTISQATPKSPVKSNAVDKDPHQSKSPLPRHSPSLGVNVSASAMSTAASTHYLDMLGLSDPYQH